MLREQLASLLRRIVDEPEQVEVEEFDTASSTVFEVRVAQSDIGKVIGRQGRTARALRSLLAERGSHDDAHYEFEVVDD
ncbi:MAG: KH domain-containing protein [Acidobacteria bacterium]|nr:KH domain-containing protein [Acidobacteriota bacterium]MCZ6726818.1 KH domain-containing protein [Acidobacteriota bacterium]